ncbi:PREDICTED: uncharacterized protein LOC105964252 isoform X2 [Erythranthe guttata]|uniref:uncharacterized protein LOC105964252 isoform X2 n=1 Tax=Erythranthe guttata TaxID=4155 RepID=UPI00064E1167|nr:PREDICTED: uncharacterized protein LOC105964252 isoform X2 [Erythranthe guttata]|eukprot:XP_012844229.1 PREDICTED: uncharacterized protein LOC105964252 isoform X2 [Erythranthe guttata]
MKIVEDEVCHETRRFSMIQRASGGQLSDQEYCDSIIRQHTMVHLRSGRDANTQGIEQKLERIENAIASLSAEVKANGPRFHKIENAIESLGAEVKANGPRFHKIENAIESLDAEVKANGPRFHKIDNAIESLGAEVKANGPRFQNIENAIASLGADLRANGARFHNDRLRNSQNWTAGDYAVVVKYRAGHPYPHCPRCPDVQFNQSYPINSAPPANLLPKNYNMFIEWQRMSPIYMREKLEGLHWFYNDSRFEVPMNATAQMCIDAFAKLDEFLRYPGY